MNHLTQTPTQTNPLDTALEHLRAAQPKNLSERTKVLLSPVFRPLTAQQAEQVFSAWRGEGMN